MIFVLDLDGTLIDSSKRHYVLMEKLLKKYAEDITFNPGDYMEYKRMGNSGKQYLKEELGLTKEISDAISMEWVKSIEDEEYMDLDELYPDTVEFLDALKQKQYKIIFLSARHNRTNTLKQLEKFGIKEYADAIYVVSPERATEEKLEVIMTYQESGKETIIVGDTENEYDTAYAAGINYFVLNRGFRSKEYWDARDVITLDDLKTLSDIIKR